VLVVAAIVADAVVVVAAVVVRGVGARVVAGAAGRGTCRWTGDGANTRGVRSPSREEGAGCVVFDVVVVVCCATPAPNLSAPLYYG